MNGSRLDTAAILHNLYYMKREKLFHNLLLRADKCECIKQCVGCLFLHVCISGKNVRTPKWKQKKSVCDDIFRIHCQWRRRCLTRKADDFIIANTLSSHQLEKPAGTFYMCERTTNTPALHSLASIKNGWEKNPQNFDCDVDNFHCCCSVFHLNVVET